MTVYVDSLHNYGWVVRGEVTPSCHMFSDEIDLFELHAIAARIGMRREWFQDKLAAPHYDLGPDFREAAIHAGAVAVDRRRAALIWRARRALLKTEGDSTAVRPSQTS
ncbi:DUF4031 domain-containing protein [Rhodanobacter sp. BL-MT-08]